MAGELEGLAQVLEAAKAVFEPVEGGALVSVDVAKSFKIADTGEIILLEDLGLGGILRGGEVLGDDVRVDERRVRDIRMVLPPGVYPVEAQVRIRVHRSPDPDSPHVAEASLTTPADLRASIGPPPLFTAAVDPLPPGGPAWVFVHLTVTTNGQSQSRAFEPFQVVQAVVPVPVAVIGLTREGISDDTDYPQLAYVMLHPSTAGDATVSSLAGQVNTVLRKLDTLKNTIGLVFDVAGLNEFLGIIATQTASAAIEVRERQWNLNDVDLEYVGFPWIGDDTEAEDVLSGLYLIGPPGTVAQFFINRDYDTDDGHFTLTSGPACVGIIPDLWDRVEAEDISKAMPVTTFGATYIEHNPSGDRHFNNRISSMRIVTIT